jgi:epidermal growth factor receptor substrate 15
MHYLCYQQMSENKAKAEKDGRDSTNQSMVESTTETLPSADITEPKVPSNTLLNLYHLFLP